MALEDFFSPTEMKNGLTTPSRVEELICLMQNQKDYATKNAGDSARQWLILANTLASTEDEECLNHLVQLNGLFFLNQWLQEALNCSHGAEFSEELINALFKSLEKLPLCKEKLNASGILVTVEKLIGHKVLNIKERAQTFFERWADERVNDDDASIDLDKSFNSKVLEDLSSNGSLLRKSGDFTSESNNLGKEVDVLTFDDLYKTSNDMVTESLDNKSHLALESEEVDYKDQSCNSFPEVIPRDFFSSESCDIVENNKQDHHIIEEPNVVFDDLDCELSLILFNPVDLSVPLMVSGSNGAPGPPILPLHLECELGLRSSTATNALDSKQKGVFSEIDLNLEELHVPYGIPSMHSSLELSSERAKTIQLSLNCVKEEEEEEEEDPSFLQLSSSTQLSMKNLDLNDDPFYPPLDSRMIIDRRDELSTQTSSSNWVPDLDLNSGMMQRENGSGEKGTLMHLFMPESRNLLGEERKKLKRKEPDSGWDPYGFGYNQLRLKL